MDEKKSTVSSETREVNLGYALKQLANVFFEQGEQSKKIEHTELKAPTYIVERVKHVIAHTTVNTQSEEKQKNTEQKSDKTTTAMLSNERLAVTSNRFDVEVMAHTLQPLPQSALWQDATWHLPERYPYFTGREIFLERMRKQLEGGEDKRCVLTAINAKENELSHSSVQTEKGKKETPLLNESDNVEKKQKGKMPRVTGSGGIGKTVLAVEYAHQAIKRKAYERVIWFDVSQSLAVQYRDLARHLGIPFDGKTKTAEIVERVYRRLLAKKEEGAPSKILLIFDNVQMLEDEENPGQSLKAFLPFKAQKEHISVLITSRNDQTWGNEFARFRLDVFTLNESVVYIQKVLTGASDEESKALAELVNCYPLALSQAVAYIKYQSKKVTIVTYVDEYKTKSKDLLNTNEARMLLEDPYLLTLWLTLGFSIRAIESEDAHKLLHYCSYLHPRGIPRFLLKSLLGKNSKWKAFDQTLAELFDFSLITQAGKGKVLIHPMVQEILRLTHSPYLRSQLLSDLTLIASEEYSQHRQPVEKELREDMLREHLVVLWKCIEENQVNNELEKEKGFFKLLFLISDSYIKHEKPRHALPLLLRLRKILEKGGSDVDEIQLVPVLASMSNVYSALGNIPEQINLLNQARKIEEENSADAQTIASILDNLGLAYIFLGKIDEAKLLIIKAMEMKELFYKGDHWSIAVTLGNLATAYGKKGEYQMQKNLLKRALKIKKVHYGENHWKLASTLGNLSNAYCRMGKFLKANGFLERALEMQEKHFGDEHFILAATLNGLAVICGALGDNLRKKRLLERALRIQENHFGKDHWQLSTTLSNLGDVNGVLGDIKRQKRLYEHAIKIMSAHYGDNHWEVARVLNNLSTVYAELGDSSMHRKLCEQALSVQIRHFGENNPIVAMTLSNLANAHEALGNFSEQKKLLERVLKVEVEHYGNNHVQIAMTLNNLAVAYGFLGDIPEKLKILDRALKIKQAHYGKEHWQLCSTLLNIGCAYRETERFVLAKNIFERVLKIQEGHYGNNHVVLVKVLNLLAGTCVNLKDDINAKALLERAVIIQKNSNDLNFQALGTTLFSLASVNLRLSNKLDAALQCKSSYVLFLRALGEEHQSTREAKMMLNQVVSSFKKNDVQKLFYQSGFLMSHNKPGEAIAVFSLLNLMFPMDPHIHHNLACCYRVVGDYKNAEMHFKRAITISRNASLFCEYGFFLMKQNRFEKAINQFKLSIKNGSDNTGLSYGLMEKPLLDEYLQLEIGETKSLNIKAVYLAYYLLVKSHLALGHQGEAKAVLQAFKVEVDKQPTPLLYRMLSYAYVQCGDKQNAQVFKEKAAALTVQLDKEKKAQEEKVQAEKLTHSVDIITQALSGLVISEGNQKTQRVIHSLKAGAKPSLSQSGEKEKTKRSDSDQSDASSDEGYASESEDDEDLKRAMALSMGK